jgi:hypothetical protein
MEFKDRQYAEVGSSPADDIEVLVVPVAWPRAGDVLNQYPAPVPGKPGVNPWRYTTGVHATNNAGRFDLWAEYIEKGKPKIISNWSSKAEYR